MNEVGEELDISPWLAEVAKYSSFHRPLACPPSESQEFSLMISEDPLNLTRVLLEKGPNFLSQGAGSVVPMGSS